MTLPTGLRWHLWHRRQLRRLHIIRPLAEPTCCSQCDTAFTTVNPIGWPSGICMDCAGVPTEERWWLHTDEPPDRDTRPGDGLHAMTKPQPILVYCQWCNKTHAAMPGDKPCGEDSKTWIVGATGLPWPAPSDGSGYTPDTTDEDD